MQTQHFIIMGICGCGKSTLAKRLHQHLHCPFAEGDDFHPRSNRDKMAAGIPLNDDDRRPWLESLRDWANQQTQAGAAHTVISCSALKRAYRDILRQAVGEVFFIHLNPPLEANIARLVARQGHFMKAGMVDSQLAALEPLSAQEAGITIDHGGNADAVWAAVQHALQARFPI